MKLNMSLKNNYPEIILSDLKDLIIKLEGYQNDADIAVIGLKGTALSDEIYCLKQVSQTLDTAAGILKEIRRNYDAASKTCDEDLG